MPRGQLACEVSMETKFDPASSPSCSCYAGSVLTPERLTVFALADIMMITINFLRCIEAIQ